MRSREALSRAVPVTVTVDGLWTSKPLAVTLPLSGKHSTTLRRMERLRNEVSYHGRNSRMRACTASRSFTCASIDSQSVRSRQSWYCCHSNAPPTMTITAAAAKPAVASRREL